VNQITTVHSLAGSGSVSIGSATTLNISNGGTFTGNMSGAGGFNLTGGTFVLTGVNTNSGNNSVRVGATLRADSTTALSSAANYQINGTLDLDNNNNAINSLTGSGIVSTGIGLGGTLTVEDGGSFTGGITGNGGFTVNGGTMTLLTATSANTYFGDTNIETGAVLIAGNENALSPNSNFILSGTAILDITPYDNTIKSLASSSSSSQVSLAGATLTINGGETTTFAGILTNTPPGALTIDGGTILTLTGTSNDYTGPTLINDGQLIIDAVGALSPYTEITVQADGTLDVGPSNSAVSVTNAGQVIVNPGPLALSDFYTQTIGAGLTLGFTESLDPILTAVNDINLTGSLTVSGTGSPTGVYPIIDSSSGDIPTEFTSFTATGFDPGTSPFLAYSEETVYLYFAGCDANWNSPGTTILERAWGRADNWQATCVPGVNGNQNDVANFGDFSGAPATITATVVNQFGQVSEQLVLGQLNLSAVDTSYTIAQYNDSSSITFDLTGAGSASINVTGGDHTIDVPLVLKVDTRLNLAEGVTLTLGEYTTLNSDTTEDFLVQATASSDTGELINNTAITPYTMSMHSATVTNESTILPVNQLDIYALASHTATINNEGAGAEMGPTARRGILNVGGAAGGSVVINNTGVGAFFGPTGSGAAMGVGDAAAITVNNTGIGASFGPSGAGSLMTIGGAGAITIVNDGVGVRLGPTGRGSDLTISSGTITNTNGAVIQAGPAAVLAVTGGNITNDVTSEIGTTNADMTFTGGTIITSGDILAYNYTQGGTSTLQLNITSANQDGLILGNVSAQGTAEVGSNLIIDALAGSITSTYDTPIDLVFAEKGVTGTYSNVQYLNFPATVIPDVIYTTDAVQLVLADTIADSPSGSFAQMGFLAVNEMNLITQRDLHNLHYRMTRRHKHVEQEQTTVSALQKVKPEQLLVDASDDTRQQHYLAERVEEKVPNAARFYVGPTGQLGSFNGKSSVQQAFDFNTIGALMGFDYAFDTVGVGISLDYSRVNAKEHHYAGKFTVDETRGALYGAWVPEQLDALAVDAIVGWGGQWFDVQRTAGHSMAPVTAKGTTRGMEADALFGLEYIFGHKQFKAMPPKVLFTPFVNAQYVWEGINGYKENGAGIYNLSVHKQTAQSLKSCLGTRFEYLVEGENVTFKPELDLAWQREYLDHNRTLGFSTINLPSTKTVSKGIVGAGRNTFIVGVDFLITVYNVFELEMSYDFEWNNLYKNNSFYLGIGGNF
jgi:autotransporter-associated beta strand protein